MKKTIIALMGLFTLVACSEDVYQDADKTNENSAVVENGSGGMQTNSYDPAIPYESPYDVAYGQCCNQVEYIIKNNTDLIFDVRAVVGLAKYDGAEDHNHFGWPLTPTTNYPNFFNVDTGEYIYFLASKYKNIPAYTSLSSGYGSQLPIYGTNNFFELQGLVPTTHHEEALMHEYGKVYNYTVSVKHPISGGTFYMGNVRVPFLPNGVLAPTQLSSDWLPLPSNNTWDGDFWYNKFSKEICAGSDHTKLDNIGSISKQKSEIIIDEDGVLIRIRCTINPTQVILSLDYI